MKKLIALLMLISSCSGSQYKIIVNYNYSHDTVIIHREIKDPEVHTFENINWDSISVQTTKYLDNERNF